MPYDRPLDPALTAMRQSGMPGRLKMFAQLAENEIIRGMTVTFFVSYGLVDVSGPL